MAASEAVVHRYFEALAAHDWGALAGTLAADVERIGPYRDIYRGRDEYVAFLAGIVPSLEGYALRVHRVRACQGGVLAELDETVTDAESRRLRTDEAIVFGLDSAGAIASVSVFTRKSYALEPGELELDEGSGR